MAPPRPARLSPLSTLTLFVVFSLVFLRFLVSRHYALPEPITQDVIGNVAVFNEARALDIVRAFAEDEAGQPRYRIVGTQDFDDSECVCVLPLCSMSRLTGSKAGAAEDGRGDEKTT